VVLPSDVLPFDEVNGEFSTAVSVVPCWISEPPPAAQPVSTKAPAAIIAPTRETRVSFNVPPVQDGRRGGMPQRRAGYLDPKEGATA